MTIENAVLAQRPGEGFGIPAVANRHTSQMDRHARGRVMLAVTVRGAIADGGLSKPRLPIRFATTTRLGGRVIRRHIIDLKVQNATYGPCDRGPLILDGREDPAAVGRTQPQSKVSVVADAADVDQVPASVGSTENVGLPVASVCHWSTLNVSEMVVLLVPISVAVTIAGRQGNRSLQNSGR